MTQDQPAVMVDDGSGNPVDRHNLRTAAWGGMIGTALEQYDFVIYGTATALVFNKLFFPAIDPALGTLDVNCLNLFSEDGRQRLLWFTPAVGTESVAKLELLAVVGTQDLTRTRPVS